MNLLPLGMLMLAQVADAPSSSVWSQMISGLDPDKRFVLLIVTIGCSVGIILGGLGIVSGMFNSFHRRRVEAEMKREMIERGMSADEIAKVIEAAAPPEDATDRWIASWGCKKKSG